MVQLANGSIPEAGTSKSDTKGEPLGVPGQRHKSRFAVAVVTHQDGKPSAGLQGAGAVADELAIAAEEVLQRGRAEEIAGVVGVEFLPPVGRVRPDEIERVGGRKIVRVAGVESLVNVEGEAVNAQILAHVAGGAAARHRVENQLRLEVGEQVLDHGQRVSNSLQIQDFVEEL